MSTIENAELQKINQEIKQKGFVDREHLLKFLTLIPHNDGQKIIWEVKHWLQALSDDPEYDSVNFPQGDIDAVIGDLDSYGRVQPQTILEFKQNSNKVVNQTT